MPPKKKKGQPKDDEPDGTIKNMYEKIPAELLDKVDNPNKHLHQLKLPFRMCVVAPSGSGKTNFLVNLISMFSAGKGTFATMTIITRNKDEPLYKWIEKKSDGQIVIKEGLSNTPVLAKDLSMVENYYIRARKMNCSVIFISQSFFKIPKIIRNNCSYMVLLKLSGNREVNMILSEFGLGITKDELLDLYKYATAEKFSPLVIDMEEDASKRFRKGLLEILDIHSY